jgi:hypothetical protein
MPCSPPPSSSVPRSTIAAGRCCERSPNRRGFYRWLARQPPLRVLWPNRRRRVSCRTIEYL